MSSSSITNLIKKPNLQIAYTSEQISELIMCSDPVTGPSYFINNYFMVQHATRGKINYHAYSYQDDMLDTMHNNRLSILMCSRQLGKSVTAAAYLLWYASFIPDSLILIGAHKYLGAREIMTKIKFGYENMPDFLRTGILEYNKGEIVMDNGSRIIAQTTTPTTGRGLSCSLIYLDEFAFVPKNIQIDFWTSITPTLSTGGRMIMTSTPESADDQFAQIWNGANKNIDSFGNSMVLGINGFKPFIAKWHQHPDRDEAWAEQQRQNLGEARFLKEHECEFILESETLIDALKLLKLSGIEPIEREVHIRWYKKPEPNKTYLVSLDPSLGTGGDPAAIQVFESPGLIQVAEWTHNKTPIEKQIDILSQLTKKLDDVTGNKNQVYYTIENNTIGEAALVTIRNLGEENIQGIFLSEPVKLGNSRKFRKGLNTTNSSKLTACAQLKQLVESNKIGLYSKALISELRTFIAIGNTYQAKTGEHDDLVMSLIGIVRMVYILKDYLPDISDQSLDDIESSMPMPFIMTTY